MEEAQAEPAQEARRHDSAHRAGFGKRAEMEILEIFTCK